MTIFPKIKLVDAHALEHGRIVVLDGGRFGLILRSVPRQGMIARNRVVDLATFTMLPVDRTALSQIYFAVLDEDACVRPFLDTATYDDTTVQAGDLFLSKGSDEGDELFLAVTDPRESGLLGVSFEHPEKLSRIHHGYVVAFQAWRMTIGEGADSVTLLHRGPREAQAADEAS